MNQVKHLKLLFIINPRSGNNDDKNWQADIEQYFQNSSHSLHWFLFDDHTEEGAIKRNIADLQPDRVIAVGGDGTIKMVAEYVMQTEMSLGIIPAGSANGLAKELNIPVDLVGALDIIAGDHSQTIHITQVNAKNCIHLSDIGFNAFVVKKFETDAHRGMFGYIKAAWKVLWQQPRMDVVVKINNEDKKMQAAMIVIANATKYGSGACINPDGKLDDEYFEVVVVKKVSMLEIYKMMVTHSPYNEDKTQVFQVKSLRLHSRRKAHFQIDGEYLGKVNDIKAVIVPAALRIMVPEQPTS